MAKETRIGLVVGLLFIAGFVWVLNTLFSKAPPPSSANPAAKAPATSEAPSIAFSPTMDSTGRLPAARVAEAPGRTSDSTTGPVELSSVTRRMGEPVSVESSMPRLGPTEIPREADRGTERVASHDRSETVRLEDLRSRLREEGSPRETVEGPPVAGDVYEVKAGDNPYRIAAAKYGPANASKYKLIMDANKITNASGLKIGMKLVIPPLPAATPTAPPSHPATRPAGHDGTTDTDYALHSGRDGATPRGPSPATQPTARRKHVVRSGESLYTIARSSGTTVDKILKLNKIRNPRALKVGTTLDIPS